MIIFASFSCPCEIIWSYLGESLLKERFRLCWPYSTLSTPGQVLHHLVQILCQIIGKKNICLRFCLKKQNISDSVWSLLRDLDKDSRKETLYLQSFSGLQDERRFLGPQSMWTFLMPDCLISKCFFSHRYISTLVHRRQVRVSEISFSKKSLSKLKYRNEMSTMKKAEGSKQIY